jgi:hypothetical protein
MPNEKKDAILKVLTETNRLVFLQSDEEFPTASNIMINSWFPQNDLLAKSRMKLFITNGEIFLKN